MSEISKWIDGLSHYIGFSWKDLFEGLGSRAYPILLLIASNVFMTYAWYGHLKDFRNKPLVMVIFLSWGVALFEYCLQVPANRMGYQFFSLGQLKVTQEIIAMCVFAIFSISYMREPLKLDFLWAGFCLVGAAYFIFRGGPGR